MIAKKTRILPHNSINISLCNFESSIEIVVYKNIGFSIVITANIYNYFWKDNSKIYTKKILG